MTNHLKIILFLLASFTLTQVSSQTVYTTKTGEKYHKQTCHYLKYSKVEIDIKKAIEFGYSACSVCKPKNLISNKTQRLKTTNSTSTSNSIKTTSTAVQCSGKTKAGSRCKRKTKSASGRCYQH